MTDPILIAPSILAADFTRLGEQIRDAEAAGAAMIHFDVIDGRFAPNITMGLPVLEATRRATRLPLDVHLMIVEPDHLLQAFATAGADHLIVHYEACTHLNGTLRAIRALGCRPGVALNPHTPASVLSEVVSLVDIVLVMTVNPGFGGQAFLPETLPKLRQVREMFAAAGKPVDVGVDGGINRETAAQTVEAGANVLVAGSSVFSGRHTVAEGIAALHAAIR